MINVAIVGVGPAGSNCAYELGKQGISSVIFDHSFPREKPCGGLVSSSMSQIFPIMSKLPLVHSRISSMQLISPSKRNMTIHLHEKMIGLSRLRFDQYLLSAALKEGAILIPEKVVDIERKGGLWKIKTTDKSYEANILVGADGVNSVVRRRIVGALPRKDIGICFGHIIDGIPKKEVTIKFLSKVKGYVWAIPRGDQTTIGGGTTEALYFSRLKQEVNNFYNDYYSQYTKRTTWTALIPVVKNVATFHIPVAGKNWILIGDAAGHVNPISGSGIIFALADGQLAANVIDGGCPERFNKNWVETYGQSIFRDTYLRALIYRRPILELFCLYMKIRGGISFN